MTMPDLGVTPPPEVLAQWALLAAAPHDPAPSTRNTIAMAACVTSLIVMIAAVAGRMWMRARVDRKVDLSDKLIFVVMISMTPLLIFLVVADYHLGLFWHRYDLSAWGFQRTMLVVFLAEILYAVNSGIVRLAILIFYRRLAPKLAAPNFHLAITVCMIFCVLDVLVFLSTLFATCRPLNAYWMRTDPIWRQNHHFKCTNFDSLTSVVNAIWIVVDFVLAVLPIMLIWNLQMDVRKKVGLVFLFSLACLPTLGAIMRQIAMRQVYYRDWDYTWANFPLWIWSIVEVGLGVTCACAPALWALYLHYHRPALNAMRRKLTWKNNNSGSLFSVSSFHAPQQQQLQPQNSRNMLVDKSTSRSHNGSRQTATVSKADRGSISDALDGEAELSCHYPPLKSASPGGDRYGGIVVKSTVDVGFEEMNTESDGERKEIWEVEEIRLPLRSSKV